MFGEKVEEGWYPCWCKVLCAQAPVVIIYSSVSPIQITADFRNNIKIYQNAPRENASCFCRYVIVVQVCADLNWMITWRKTVEIMGSSWAGNKRVSILFLMSHCHRHRNSWPSERHHDSSLFMPESEGIASTWMRVRITRRSRAWRDLLRNLKHLCCPPLRAAAHRCSTLCLQWLPLVKQRQPQERSLRLLSQLHMNSLKSQGTGEQPSKRRGGRRRKASLRNNEEFPQCLT